MAGGTLVDRARNEPVNRVSYDEYVLAVALTLARRHRPVWSWQHWRRICQCGADLPCRARHRIPINRGHWPQAGEQ
ncbi:hypothetical protein E0H26_24285 [Micromonospora zingiberis]|uniref:Uncharacterized protein n=1 Tax=Micromonospora zingiberis TaxID=2053011 RepID=A0A4R0G5R6_9ACTN|nr:hypothetical protein E0H26_24285 [Micromonospora zingiberis]